MADDTENPNGANPAGTENVIEPGADQTPEPEAEPGAGEPSLEELVDQAVAKATSELNTQISALTEQLKQSDEAQLSWKSHAEKSDQQLAALRESRDTAVSKYRDSLLSANPLVPIELVTGDTIEAIDASMETAKTLVTRIKEGVAGEVDNTSIPAGAPPRSGPDFDGMSTRDKINYGLNQSRK